MKVSIDRSCSGKGLYMFGIDAGGTFIKYGSPEESFHMEPLPYEKSHIEELFQRHSPPYLATGAGAETIANWFPEIEITIVSELLATGLGGAHLADVDKCIVINIGSGTPVLFADRTSKNVAHITGTGLGSASLAGLSYYMTGIEDLGEIEEAALSGDPNRVNLLVRDVYKNTDLIDLPGDITASNFGKYQDWRHLSEEEKPNNHDLLAGLHRMVGETIAVIVNAVRGQFSEEELPVVITGGGTLNKALVENLEYSFSFFKQPYVVPEQAVYSTLYGLFVVTNDRQ